MTTDPNFPEGDPVDGFGSPGLALGDPNDDDVRAGAWSEGMPVRDAEELASVVDPDTPTDTIDETEISAELFTAIPNRIVPKTYRMSPNDQPVMLYPADPLRVSLTISVSGTNAGDEVYVSPTRGGAQSEVTSVLVWSANPLTLVGFTGEVWVKAAATSSGATMTISATVVTQ